MAFRPTDLCLCKNKVKNSLFCCLFEDSRQFVLKQLPIVIEILHVEMTQIVLKDVNILKNIWLYLVKPLNIH